MATELSGKIIKGYELRELLGAGGFGAVYLASQPAVGREVAIKVILPALASQPEFIRRFETEAQLVARLEHPFIVPLFDYWRDLDGAYLVMRLFRGGSLRNAIDSGHLNHEQALNIIDQIAGALAVAHRNNVIHRDLKPDNILLDNDGNAFLTDFGIAKIKAKGSSTEEDEDEGIAGSPGYMAPEQIISQPISARTDIYSLGVIIYEMLTGRHPFPNQSTTELIMSQLQLPVPELHGGDLPLELNEVIQRATAKDPEARYADTLSLAAATRRALTAGRNFDDFFATNELYLETVNPYKGLRPFEEADAADFFGREALIMQLVARMNEAGSYTRFLAVVGPSGSGKSSVVKAGLLPALRWGEVPGSERWFMVEMVPGTDALEHLEAALTSVAVIPADVNALLNASERGLLEAVRQILPVGGELLLVIDQFEEIFTLLDDEGERGHFLGLIRTAITDPMSQVRVIVTLRADFYDRPLLYEGFGALMRARTEVVLPLSTEELERAITAPAERVGLTVESNLLAAIIADVSEEPGALPLLEYGLTEVFERREGRTLTLAAYQASGGALGALARRADELFEAMDAEHQEVTRQLFLRLVTLGEGTEDTRRRVLRSELMSLGTETLQNVLDQFGKYRLLSFDRDSQTREPTIEVAHEALIREWKRLREWLTTSRDAVRQQRQLASAANDWLEAPADGKESFLLRGSRLEQVEHWAAETDLALTRQERDFLDASIARRQELQAQEAARAEHEKRLQRRVDLILRALVAVMSLAFLGALILSVFAFNQREIAQSEREIAQAERNNAQTQVAIAATAAFDAQTQQMIAQREAAISLSLALAASASQLESNGNHELALALIVAANGIPNPPDQAQRALAEIAYAPGMMTQFDNHTAPVNGVKFSPDGRYVLSASDDYSLALWDVEDRSRVRSFIGHTLPVASVAFSPDGTQAFSGSLDSTLILWDVATGKSIRQFRDQGALVRAVAMLPDGKRALSGSTEGVILWDLTTGDILARFDEIDSVYSLTVHNSMALVGTEDSTLLLLNLDSGEIIHDFRGHTSAVLSVAFSPDGTVALSGSRDNSLILWDVESGGLLRRLTNGHSQPVNSIVFTPDGTQALTVSDDLQLLVWDMDRFTVLRRFGASGGRGEHTARITGVAISPDGSTAATGGADNRVILWSVDGGAQIATYTDQRGSIADVAFSRGGTRIFSAADDGTLLLRDSETGEILRTYTIPEGALVSAAFSPNGQYIAAGLSNNQIIVWDANSDDITGRVFSGHQAQVNALAFSPDGTKLIAGAEDNLLILWDVPAGKPLMTLGGEGVGHSRRVLSVAFAPNGKTVLSGSFDRTLILWDVATGEPIYTLNGHTRRVLGIAYSPDSLYAVSGSDDTSLILWDLQTGQAVRTFGVSGEGGGQPIFSVAYSPDATTVLAGTETGAFILWDVGTGNPVRRFQVNREAQTDGPPVAVTRTAFSYDGKTALTGLRDGRVIVWEMPPLSGLLDWVHANRYVTEFTCDERIRYNITPLCDTPEAPES